RWPERHELNAVLRELCEGNHDPAGPRRLAARLQYRQVVGARARAPANRAEPNVGRDCCQRCRWLRPLVLSLSSLASFSSLCGAKTGTMVKATGVIGERATRYSRPAEAAAAVLTKRPCSDLGASSTTAALELPSWATLSVVMRSVTRNSSRDSSCKSSHGGTFSDSDNSSPAPPISKVYLARRPISRSTVMRSSAL